MWSAFFIDVDVVLDDDDGVAAVDEPLQHASSARVSSNERPVVGSSRMYSVVPVRALRQLGRQLDALRLAAGERRRRLAEADVAEADVAAASRACARTRGKRSKNSQRLVDGHVQHVGDVLALEQDLQRLAVVALALADLAGHRHVRQELHLDLDVAVARAGLAAAALHVEGEAARLVAAQPRLGHGGEQLADRREQAGVGRRVRARRAADRRLVDVDDLVDVLQAVDGVALAGRARGRRRAPAPRFL